MSEEIYTNNPRSTNSDSPQSRAGSAAAREIRRAAVFICEARRLLLSLKPQVRNRTTWHTLENVAAVSGRLVDLLEPTAAKSHLTPKPENPQEEEEKIQ